MVDIRCSSPRPLAPRVSVRLDRAYGGQMLPSRLIRETHLGIELSEIMARNQYTTDPLQTINDLRRVAGSRTDLLAREAGLWAGYNAGDSHTRTLVTALATIHGAAEWVEVGKHRRGMSTHPSGPVD